jgi:class 3 adenylate cyclase/predicted ATPase/ABC-type transport system involved in cytochrome c biogenesis ATPase subunit
MGALSTLLQELGLERYTPVFVENDVDLEALRLLTEADLERLGVSLGHRRKLLKAIAELNGTEASAAAAQAVQDQPPSEESLHAEAQRRQLTVMFCDLVGSTALAERLDPEQLRDLMQAYQRACRDVIARYEGHVAQYLGDGLMVYFGWPQAHEDDAVRAIRAGLEVTQAVSKLTASTPIRARVGIHTGLVVVGETGHGDASIPKAAVGDTPNIAARLQGLAEPSSVVVSERTSSLARGLFDYTDLGTQALKGVSEPTRLFRVLGARATASRFEASRSDAALTPLVGREEEIALLLRRWQQAKEGEGQVVLVGGEPGIGKSRLTRVLRERLDQQRHIVLRYQCSPYHLNSALYPAIEQFEHVAGFTREDTSEQKLDKMQAVLAGSEHQSAESAALFAALLSLPTERYPTLNLSPQKQKEKTLEALAGRVEALAQRQPLLILYEDVHWIDATSAEAMDLLVPRLRDLPVLVIVTHRPEYNPRWTDQAHVTTLGLNRLGRRQGAELVAKLTDGKALPVEVLDQILTHTDGVPLFIEELTKSVLESKLLREAGDGYVLEAPLPALAIPTTLRDSLIARLDRLAPVREVAQIGACIGREFSYELLTALSPLKGERLEEALEQLTKTGLVFRRGTPPDATYTFKHALVQDAAYDSLLKSKRSQLHAQVAQVLENDLSDAVANEPEVLAHHFTQAGLNERAVPYWIQAGQRALTRVALAEAVAHLTSALGVNERLPVSVERDKQELDIRLRLGIAYQSYLGWAAMEVVQTLEPARELAIRLGEPEKLFQILDHSVAHYLNRCEFPRVLKINEEVDALARSRNDSTAIVIARLNEALTHNMMGNFKAARQATDLMLQDYDPEQHGQLVQTTYNYDAKCLALASAGNFLWALGYADQARQATLKGLDLAQRLGHAFNFCLFLDVGIRAVLWCGETRLARQWLAESKAIAREHAMAYFADVLLPISDGSTLIEQGDYSEGYAKVVSGQKLYRDAGALFGVPGSNMMRARALMGLGRFDEARGLLDEAVEIINRTGHRMDEAEVHRVLGGLQQRQTNPDFKVAENSYVKALEVARSQEAKGFELRAAMSLARLWQSQGKRKEACELLAPIYNWFTEGFDTKDLIEAKALLEEVARAVNS